MQTEKRIQKYIDQYLKYGFSKFIVIDKISNHPIGDAGLMNLDGTEFVELGYRFKKEYWGQGIATEAASSIIRHAFTVDKFENIHAIVEPDNLVSIHIITNKLNFEFVKQDTYFGEIFNLYFLDTKFLSTTIEFKDLENRFRHPCRNLCLINLIFSSSNSG